MSSSVATAGSTGADDPVEPAVQAAWSHAFGRPALPDSDIFACLDLLRDRHGVERSIVVHEMLAEIAEATGVALPLNIIFTAPTPRLLSRLVRSGVWAPIPRPLLMRPAQDSTAPALYTLPGAGGMGLDMIALVQSLRHAGPIYMGQPAGLDGTVQPSRTIATIVADQLELLRMVQPRGPYYLLGYSWGGEIAIEMSRVLRREGETVAFLGVIEPRLGEPDWPFSVLLGFYLRRIGLHLARLRGLSARQIPAYAIARVKPLIGRLARKFGVIRPFGWSPSDQDGLPGIIDVIWRAEVAAGESSRMTFYDGTVSFFATRHGLTDQADPSRIWPRYVRDLDLEWLDGNHMSVLQMPGVAALAAQIDARIERAMRA